MRILGEFSSVKKNLNVLADGRLYNEESSRN